MATGIASMAWRNLWRNRRRTIVTLSSIAFGTMLAILSTGFGDHNFSQMIDLATSPCSIPSTSRCRLSHAPLWVPRDCAKSPSLIPTSSAPCSASWGT